MLDWITVCIYLFLGCAHVHVCVCLCVCVCVCAYENVYGPEEDTGYPALFCGLSGSLTNYGGRLS